jgi:predicted esterase
MSHVPLRQACRIESGRRKQRLCEGAEIARAHQAGHAFKFRMMRLLWHGDADDVVPPGDTFRLQQALTQSGLATNLTCHWQKGVITGKQADETILKQLEDQGVQVIRV